jgi:hypothetical protein
MTPTASIPRRFCGPPDSGNGGFTCGTVAGFVDGDAVVTLRLPPPLEVELDVEAIEGVVRLMDGDAVVAEAKPTVIDAHPPTFVPLDEAAEAASHYAGLDAHPFPTCFTCGPDRAVGDGLRVFPGPVRGSSSRRASTWTPHESLTVQGAIPEPVVWAALDCPSGWTHLGDGTVAVLGRMAARVDRLPVVGETYVVVGEATGVDGRKRFATSALFDAGGELLAVADTIWITIDPATA